MSFSPFFAGLAGLQANNRRLESIGNNLANLNTIGFKSSRVTFNDVFSGFTGFDGVGNPQQVGRGVQISGIDSIFSQGSLSSTSLLTDLAIQGEGFFVTANPLGGESYTRAGNFSFDSNGNLVASNGRSVRGFTQADASGNIVTSGSLNNIQIPTGLTAPPQETGEMLARLNLNAAYDGDFVTSVTTFDSLGQRHDLTITFQPADTDADTVFDAWTYDVTADGADVVGGTAGTPFSLATGTVSFDANGQLTAPAGNVTVNIPGWNNGAAAQTIDWQLYDTNGSGALTGFSAPSAISSSSQNGYGVGSLTSLTIGQDGLVSGIFTNGVNLQLARIALATFNNANGLMREGQNSFISTNASGTATIGAANSGGRGIVVSNSLELSNVDITEEFTDMIITQRGYQANSRIITTTDEVIQEALNLKR